jgi:CRISPR/Cas system-associated exonuclease Cas4 (RecB family)
MLSTYSHTALNTYRTCPRKFKFQYVEKVEVPKKVTADTYMGNAVHRVLARLYKLGADGIVYPVNDLIAFYDQQWEKVDRQYIALTDEYHTVDDYIRLGREMLVRHYEHYQPFNQGTLLGTELNIVFTLPRTGQSGDATFKIRAIIDRLWKRDDGVVEICDYKTGRSLARPQDESFFYQMGLYQLAVRQHFPQFETIELAQYFLRSDEVVRHRMHPDELERLTEETRTSVVETINAVRLDSFPAQEGGWCHYCNYFDLCPAKRHKLMLSRLEEQEKESDQTWQQRAYELATQYIESYRKVQSAKAELEALRAEVIELSKDQDLSTLEGATGKVTVKTDRKEKFITKSEDSQAFADLSHSARQWQLDDYFVLDTHALMKELYQKKRLSTEQMETLKQYVVEKEESRITVKLSQEIQEDTE